MADIISTDPAEISREIIQSVEAQLGPMMPGDERRIFLDQLAYVFAAQNAHAVQAWNQNSPELASGDALTALGQRVGVSRSAGQPAIIRIRIDTSAAGVSLPVGFRFALAGTSWAVSVAATDSQNGEATAENSAPPAGETAAQNAVVSGIEATALDSPPAGVLAIFSASLGGAGVYVQRAEASDLSDDEVFRARVIAHQRRSFDWRDIARRVIPDASDVFAYLASPGEVRIVVCKRDADCWTRALTADENTALTAALQASEERPLGDHVEAVQAAVKTVTASLTVHVRRGWLASASAAASAAIEAWCRASAGHLGGDVDSGDLVRIIDGIEGVRWVNVSSFYVGGLPLIGTPPHVAIEENTAARCVPSNILLTFEES